MASPLEIENRRLRLAIDELLRQRNDYALALNVLDGRQRRVIASVDEWFAILEAWQREWEVFYEDAPVTVAKSA